MQLYWRASREIRPVQIPCIIVEICCHFLHHSAKVTVPVGTSTKILHKQRLDVQRLHLMPRIQISLQSGFIVSSLQPRHKFTWWWIIEVGIELNKLCQRLIVNFFQNYEYHTPTASQIAPIQKRRQIQPQQVGFSRWLINQNIPRPK